MTKRNSLAIAMIFIMSILLTPTCFAAFTGPWWTQILNVPTTLSGFGITDAYTNMQVDAAIASISTKGDAETFSVTSSTNTIPVNGAATTITIASGSSVWANATVQCVLAASGTSSIHTWELKGCFENLDNTLSNLGTSTLYIPSTLGIYDAYYTVSGANISITASGPKDVKFKCTRFELLTVSE